MKVSSSKCHFRPHSQKTFITARKQERVLVSCMKAAKKKLHLRKNKETESKYPPGSMNFPQLFI